MQQHKGYRDIFLHHVELIWDTSGANCERKTLKGMCKRLIFGQKNNQFWLYPCYVVRRTEHFYLCRYPVISDNNNGSVSGFFGAQIAGVICSLEPLERLTGFFLHKITCCKSFPALERIWQRCFGTGMTPQNHEGDIIKLNQPDWI